eukprot:gene14365-19267_t
MDDLVLLTQNGLFKQKVSSVLNGSAEFSSKFMFDNNLDTCWNSDQGSPQFIIIDFLKPVSIHLLKIMFQGGFVGQECVIEVGDNVSSLLPIHQLDVIEDSNEMQSFPITSCPSLHRFMKIIFNQSTDFYG